MSGSEYTQKQFQSDLDELTNLINNYAQDGGKKRSRSGKKSKKSRSGKKSKSMKRKSPKRKSMKKKSKSSKKNMMNNHMPKRKKSKKSKKSGGKRMRHLDADGNPIRSFRVIKIGDKDVSGNKKYAIRYYHGTRKNNTPGKAAEHAFSKLCTHTGHKNKATCKVTFLLKETTKGGGHKEYGPYSGKFKKLLESRKVTRRDPKTGKKSTYTVHFKPYVVLAGKK